MNSYKLRLIFPLSLIIFLVLGTLGVVLSPFLKEFYLDRMYDRVEKESELITYYLEEIDLNHLGDLQETAIQIAERLDVRITILDLHGEVLAETAADTVDLENRLMRSEVQLAIEEGVGRKIRTSTTENIELLYYVTPLKQNGEQFGYLRIGIAMDELNEVYQNIWTLLFISFFTAFLIILLLVSQLTNQMIRPIEDARRVANELARGNFTARTFEGNSVETGELNRSINVLAENLNQVTKTYKNQQERMETLIENMGSGLLLIDEKGDITLINQSCNDIFDEETGSWIDQLYHKVIKYKKVIKFIQQVFLTEKPTRKQIKLSIGIYIRHFEVHGAPIIGSDGKLKGIVVVFHDITELKKLEQARKDFVGNVSHELKTPVTSLKGFTETLLAGAMDDEKLRKRFLTIIANESERLEGLIYDLLELSKIEGDQFQLNWQEVNIDLLLEEVLFMLNDKAQAKKMIIDKKVEGMAKIEGDPHRIKQILINLINNAIVYTPEEGKIVVKVKELENTVLLEVQDTGIGITKKEIPRIFERFYRVDRARSRNSGGTGLGLAIVKHLAEAHQAKLSVESDFGKGTTFQIVFFKNHKV